MCYLSLLIVMPFDRVEDVIADNDADKVAWFEGASETLLGKHVCAK